MLMAGCLMVAGQSQETSLDSGKLVMFKGGKMTGSETFTIKNPEGAESVTTLNLEGASLNFRTATDYQGAQPKSFSLVKEPGTRLLFTIDGGQVKVTGTTEASGKTDASALILENLVWHQLAKTCSTQSLAGSNRN